MHRRLSFSVCAAVAAVSLAACSGNGNPGPPAAPTFVVNGFGTSSTAGTPIALDAATAYALTVSETASGGATVTPGPLTIVLDTAAVGTVSGTTLTTGTGNATGHLTITDTKTGRGVTFTVSVLSTHPATAGDTLTLAGSLTHTIARPQPAPSAIASPVVTTEVVTDTLTIPSVSASFGSGTGFIDEHVVETDAAPLQTITTTSDAFASFVASGGQPTFAEAGFTSTNSNGVSDRTTFGTGNGIVDRLPDTNGATFANSAALTFDETEPDTTTVTRAVNADGTYAETDTFLGSDPATFQASADLSASFTSFSGLGVNVTYGAPSGGSIPITIAIVPPNTPQTITGAVGDWFPTTTIASDSFAKATAVSFPASCKTPATVGGGGTQIVETKTHLDTALGTYEKRTATTYEAPGFGAVCVVLADEIDAYYDYTGQTPGPIIGLNLAVSSTPIQIDTIAETIGFAGGSVSGSSVVRGASQTLSTSGMLRAVTPLFDRAVAAVYRSRRDAAKTYLATHRAALAKEFRR